MEIKDINDYTANPPRPPHNHPNSLEPDEGAAISCSSSSLHTLLDNKHISDQRVRFSWDILVVTTLNQSMVRSSAVGWGCGHTLVNVGESLLTSTLLEVSHQVTRMVNPLTI